MNAVLAGFVALGWVFENRKKHVIVYNPKNPLERVTASHGRKSGGWEHLKRARMRLKKAVDSHEGRP